MLNFIPKNIIMDKNKKEKICNEFEKNLHNQIFESLKNESDRAKLILVASWIDHFLYVKLQNEFSKGNKKALKNLFSTNGPFATLSSKLNIAFCAGWIDSDVYHDIQIIKKLRNHCAHSIENISSNEERIRDEIEKFLIPKRKFYDWGRLWAVSNTKDEIIISTGKKPNNVKENLYIPGSLTLDIALPIIFTVLVSNLKLPFYMKNNNKDIIFTIDIPDYMKKVSSKI